MPVNQAKVAGLAVNMRPIVLPTRRRAGAANMQRMPPSGCIIQMLHANAGA